MTQLAVRIVVISGGEEANQMLNKSLVLLSATAFCLTSLSILLTEAQQRAIATWNVRAWSAIDQCRRSLAATRVAKIMHEDPPLVTALGTIGLLVIGIFWSCVFGCYSVVSVAAFLGGILLAFNNSTLNLKDAELIALYGAIAATSLTGLFIGMKAWLLSVAIMVVAIFLIPLSIVEFVTRRLAEYEKGPLVALGVLVAAVLSFLKAIF
jgi:hypothetical protein